MWLDKCSRFYGSGMWPLLPPLQITLSVASSFVFQLSPQMKVFRATGYNSNYQYLNDATHTMFNGIGMGGQEGYASLVLVLNNIL